MISGSEIIDMDAEIGPDALAVLPDGKVECMICSKTLSNATSGRRHYLNSHQPTEAAKCSVCQKTYKNMQTMKAHMKRDHNISQKMMKAARSSIIITEPNVVISTNEDNDETLL